MDSAAKITMCESSGKTKRCGKQDESRIFPLDVGLDLGSILGRKFRALVAAALDQHEIIHLQAFSINGAVEDMEKAERVALGFRIIAQGTGIKRRMIGDDQDFGPLMLIFSSSSVRRSIKPSLAQLSRSDRRRMFLEPPLIRLTPQDNTVNQLHVLVD